MKKLLTFLILTYLLFTINSSAISQSTNGNIEKNNEILKIGVLVPLSGEFKQIGQSVLKAIQMAVYELDESNIEIKKMIKKYSHKDVVEFISKKENLPKKIVYNYCLKLKDNNWKKIF